jgi:hypothetical protein
VSFFDIVVLLISDLIGLAGFTYRRFTSRSASPAFNNKTTTGYRTDSPTKQYRNDYPVSDGNLMASSNPYDLLYEQQEQGQEIDDDEV